MTDPDTAAEDTPCVLADPAAEAARIAAADAEERAKPKILPDGNFEGHPQRYCGEHRTVGPHRAWCFDDHEWCYPDEPCRGCDESVEVKITRAVKAERERIRDGSHRFVNGAVTDGGQTVHRGPGYVVRAELLDGSDG